MKLVKESLEDFLYPKTSEEFESMAQEIIEDPDEYFEGGAQPSYAEYKDGHFIVGGFEEMSPENFEFYDEYRHEFGRLEEDFDLAWEADVDIANETISISGTVTSPAKPSFEYTANGEFEASNVILGHIDDALTFLMSDIQTNKELAQKFMYGR